MGEVDALLNVTLEILGGGLQEGLLLGSNVGQGVLGLLGAVGLQKRQCVVKEMDGYGLTPSSMGTEKKSTPAAFATSSPPGTPGR